MIFIKIKENDSFDFSIKKFKKLCEKSGIISEIKKREFYEKPSTKRKKIKIFLKKKYKKVTNK